MDYPQHTREQEVSMDYASFTQPYQPWQPVDAGESSTQPYQQSLPAATGEANSEDGRKFVRVKVQREKHTIHADKYVFEGADRWKKETFKEDWIRIKYEGKGEWAYYGRRTIYISDIEIE
ncbi:hypothetical protein DL768_011751 [Monosporascus sp. mg162]|nr:hypothetical protein DL768_011751 [Monosporascus sp. mg162]